FGDQAVVPVDLADAVSAMGAVLAALVLASATRKRADCQQQQRGDGQGRKHPPRNYPPHQLTSLPRTRAAISRATRSDSRPSWKRMALTSDSILRLPSSMIRVVATLASPRISA